MSTIIGQGVEMDVDMNMGTIDRTNVWQSLDHRFSTSNGCAFVPDRLTLTRTREKGMNKCGSLSMRLVAPTADGYN